MDFIIAGLVGLFSNINCLMKLHNGHSEALIGEISVLAQFSKAHAQLYSVCLSVSGDC